MDTFDLIENAEYISNCKSTKENKYIMPLDKIDFWDVYRESTIRDTFLLIDISDNINFYIKLKDLTKLSILLGNNNISICVQWNYYGPEIILNIDGLAKIPGFVFEINKNFDLFILQKFLKQQYIFIQYIIQDEKGIIKLLTKKVLLDSSFIEKLKYFIELDFYNAYPRIDEEDIVNKNGYYITTNSDITILEDVLDMAENLKKQFTKGTLTIHVEAREEYTFILSGKAENVKIMLDGLLMSINIREEGRTYVRGIPFFKYENELLYFFNYSESSEKQ